MVNLLFNGHFPEVSTEIRTWYGRKALREVRDFELKDSAKKRIDVQGITIDKADSRDLDDGIWAYKNQKWNYVMQVSITDVAELIAPFSGLDFEALDRATSIYLDTHVIHMFPKEIAADIGSLNHQTTRLTQTVEIELTPDFETIRVDFFESRFTNINRYDHYGFFIDSNSPTAWFYESNQLLYKIAQWLYFQRLWNLKIRDFEDADRKIQLWTETFWETENNISSFVVQEFMIKANIEAAKLMVREEVDGIFRNHMPEFKHIDDIPQELERAMYESAMKYHLWLWEDFYCHFTSPLRRYADLIVHRQLKRLLRWQETVYSQEEVQKLCEYINTQITALLELQKFRSIENRGLKIYRKIKKQNWVVNPEDIKWHIKYHAIYGDKIPEITRKVIIESIKRNPKVPDWIMLVMIGSQDSEIIAHIKEKVLADNKVGRYYKILENVGELTFSEQIQENDFWASVEFTAFYAGKQIYKTKRHASFPKIHWIPQKRSRKINYERYKARKKGLEKFFDSLLEQKKTISP